MNRQQLQQLAAERVRDAEALLSAGRWSGAYYLAGYAVECGLKACIAKLTAQYDFPDKDMAMRCYTHNLDSLIVAAKLHSQLKAEMTANLTFATYWPVVVAWNEKARYVTWNEVEARKLLLAVTDPMHGTLTWITGHW